MAIAAFVKTTHTHAKLCTQTWTSARQTTAAVVKTTHVHTHTHTHTHTRKPVHSDVDECASNNGGCHSQRKCTNTVGSFKCEDCPAGYGNDGAKGCKGLCVCACVCVLTCTGIRT